MRTPHCTRFALAPIVAAVLFWMAVGLAAPTETAREEGTSQGSVEESNDKPRNTLRWTTASEVDNFGFEVYRALDKDGPFKRITADPIPGAGTSDLPGRYSYVDDKIDPTRDYYYYVESISMDGTREQFTPIIKAAAKAKKKKG